MTKPINPKDGQHIECPYCAGKGQIPLPIHLKSILAILAQFPEGLTSSEICKKYCQILEHNAMNQRLKTLIRLELVKKEKNGKAWVWISK